MEKEMGGSVIEVSGYAMATPLGMDVTSNMDAILRGESRLCSQKEEFDLPEPFCGSIFDRQNLSTFLTGAIGPQPEMSLFERLCVYTASKAIEMAGIDPSSDSTLFILSTTKGNVDMIASDPMSEKAYLSSSASSVAEFFGNHNIPLVVSNACISGVCAQIAAVRSLTDPRYRDAVVIGADMLSAFIVSGFQSFKALSPEPCRPYDAERNGLNLGEGCGCLVLSRSKIPAGGKWRYVASANHNDANHISGPSRTGEGSCRVLRDILHNIPADEIAFVNAHGTSTAYNDEMESIAIERAGLSATPVNSLKGFFGHTLGAAGVIETILSMMALDKGLILPVKGYNTPGTSKLLNVSSSIRATEKNAFIKILSGFGGCNAGICYRKEVSE